MAHRLGIDFGTSNTTLSFWNKKTGAPDIILSEGGNAKIPSLLYLDESKFLFGDAAANELENALHYPVDKQFEIMPSIVREIKLHLDDDMEYYTTSNRPISAVEGTRLFLQYLREYANAAQFHDEPVTALRITYPVSFSEISKKNLEKAAKGAGFSEVEMMQEPVAAALGYVSQRDNVGEHILVYDIGGGTFDLAYVCLDRQGRFYVPLLDSVEECAGIYFDQAIYHYLSDRMKKDLKVDFCKLDHGLMTGALEACRKSKEKLSSNENACFYHQFHNDAGKEYNVSVMVNRSELENLIGEKIDRTLRATLNMIEKIEREMGHKIDEFVDGKSA